MWDIPSRDYTVNKIHDLYDSTNFIRDLYKEIISQKWEEELYNYFSEVYEWLFTNLMLKKTFVSTKTKKMLEILAMPIYKKDESEKNIIYDDIENRI